MIQRRLRRARVVLGRPGIAGTGITQSEKTALMTDVARVKARAISVADYGAKGDNTTDDTTAIRAAIAAWLTALRGGGAGGNATLLFPPGRYRITDTITIQQPASGAILLDGGAIEGFGATLRLQHTTKTTALEIKTEGSGNGWRGLTLSGLLVESGDVAFLAGTDAEKIYNLSLIGGGVEKGKVTPLLFRGPVFEVVLAAPVLAYDPARTPAAQVQSCISIIQHPTLGGQPSSFDLAYVTTRGGYHGLYDGGNADVKVHGGTYLQTQREGLWIKSSGFSLVKGVHVENCWLVANATTASSERAAVFLEGSGAIEALYTISNHGASVSPYTGSSRQNYAVWCYAYATDAPGNVVAGRVLINGITHQNTNVGYQDVRVAGGAAGSVVEMHGAGGQVLSPITNGRLLTSGQIGPGQPAMDLYGGGIQLAESAEPALPTPDRAVLFLRDNGSGKTQLCVKYASGAVSVIHTQP
jgi:hypothetical protein